MHPNAGMPGLALAARLALSGYAPGGLGCWFSP